VTRVLTTDKALSLVGGLEWRPAGEGRASRAALREVQRLTDATHHVLAKSGSEVMYGLHAPLDEQERLPRSAHSAAAIFAAASREAQLPATALLLRLASPDEAREARAREPQYYLVVIQEGLPLIDLVADRAKVLHALGDYGHHALWSDDQVEFPNSQPASLAWLAKLPSTGTRITRVPINLLPSILAICGVALCAAGWVAWAQHRQAQQQRELLAQAQLADPGPRYLQALHLHRAQMSSRRADVLRQMESLFDLPIFVEGWQLKAAHCGSSGACEATWHRRGGDYLGLARSLPSHALHRGAAVSEGLPALNVPDLDLATTRWSVPVSRHELQDLPSMGKAVEQASPTFQQWKLATLAVDWREPTLWPNVPDVDPGFIHEQALKRGELVVTSVPVPLALEVMQAVPAWVSWERLDLTVADPAGEPSRALNLTITGNYYVSVQ
jgi:Pilin accessory protein (PilO)